jgi:hypothetical protein
MYFVFKEFQLPNIPLVVSDLQEEDIKRWKGDPAVENCYKKLFKKIKNSNHETYMSKIVQKLRKTGRNKVTTIQIAYAISVCEILLNPKNLHIQIKDDAIKQVLEKNLVSIYIKRTYKYFKLTKFFCLLFLAKSYKKRKFFEFRRRWTRN